MRVFAILLTFCFGVLSQGVAAQSSYKSWQNPDAAVSNEQSDKRLQEFINKLTTMVDKAEKARAADPIFLRDLRDLARGFDRPWLFVVLSDAFLDGNYEFDPTWQVASGEYWIEKGWGLRSAIKNQAAPSNPQPTRRSGNDAAAVLFGQILNQALGGNKRQAATPTTTQPANAIIHSSAQIPNAFALEANFSSWTNEGRLEWVMYQGNLASAARTAGYRLAYIPGGTLELMRVSSRGTTIVDTTKLNSPLEDKNFHAIEWLRYGDGRMVVSVDGQEVLSVADRGFRDPFNGIALMNHGGDYIVKEIKISGAR